MPVVLSPHPATLAGPITRIEVEMICEGVILWLRYTAVGEVDRVAWPQEAPPGRTNDLWRRTCFEAFVGTPDGYREYNLSPSGRWATFAFDGYRSGMADADEVATVALLDGGFDQTALEARIELPPDAQSLGLSAVIEDVEGGISYWALAHPSDKPDFHHPDSFTLVLPAPGPAEEEPA